MERIMQKRSLRRTVSFLLAGAMFMVTVSALAACGSASSGGEGPSGAAVSADNGTAGGSSGTAGPETEERVQTAGALETEITVSASSTVSLVPDMAEVSFGVTSEAASAQAALDLNGEAVQEVIDTLTARGVEERSIRTTNYALYPKYDYSGRGEPRLTGYTVYTSMSVQDQGIDELGELITACVSAGINHIDSVTFLCSGYDEAYREALAQAVAEAQLKADALAQAAGRSRGEIVSITEGWQDTSARYVYNSGISEVYDEDAVSSAAASLQPGETEVSASVTVTFRMG